VSEGFQPAGRAAAPPPLDVVQDFVNTEIPEWARDDIGTPAALEAWLRARGLLEADDSVDAVAFVRARELRAALRVLALGNTLGAPPDDELRQGAARALARVTLGVTVDEAGAVVPVSVGGGVDRALGVLLSVVLDAQASGTWRRLKACRKETCGWLFYDASRNHSAMWCSMSNCGNRAKTASYRRRRAGNP
jgi:predicted RNA-binding Zn ribbon-like protein